MGFYHAKLRDVESVYIDSRKITLTGLYLCYGVYQSEKWLNWYHIKIVSTKCDKGGGRSLNQDRWDYQW